MIGAFKNRAERTVSAAVLMRDAVRLARRWQTYAIRAAFSAALLCFVLGAIWAVTNVALKLFDPSDLGKAGATLFRTYAVVQVLFAALVAPFTVASAVIEEREQGTIDLLLITRLDARRILGAKILARLLVLITVVLGGLPVIALVTTIGGVSVIEVVAVTVHALVACVVLGALAGFFAVFTKYPVVATVASLMYGFLAFVFAPALYVTLTGDVRGLASFSPLYGFTARDLWALLPALSYAPVVWLALVLGARFYELKVSRAKLSQLFLAKNWALPSITWGSVALGVAMVSILPFAVAGSWVFTVAEISRKAASVAPTGWAPIAIDVAGGLSRFVIWTWCVGALYLGTWVYLRLTSDMVMLTDDLVDPRGKNLVSGPQRPVYVWNNPVAWKSLRLAHWRAVFPAFWAWGVVLLAVFQMGVWIVPGGLLAVGGLNTLGALVTVVWLGASSIEYERRTGSFEILMTTTMSAFSIVWGKVLGVLGPSAPMIALSVLFVGIGGPHLHVLFLDKGDDFGLVLVRSALASAWVVGLWLLAGMAAMTLALALPNPRSAYPVALVGVGLLSVGPPTLGAFAQDVPVLSSALRLLVPVLVGHPDPWEMAVSTAAMVGLAAGLFVLCCVKLRTWGLRHA